MAWAPARQHTVSHSSTEAEFIACDTGARALTWLASLARELRIAVAARPFTLRIHDKLATKYHEGQIECEKRDELLFLTENKGVFDISHINLPSKRTKHLDVRHFYLQQKVLARALRLTQFPTSKQWAYFLTKVIGRVPFQRPVRNIGYPI